MKKIFWNSWVTKLLFSGYTTITIFCFIFTKYSKDIKKDRQYLINHECVHAQQWSELFIITAIILFIIDICLGNSLSLIWYCLCPLMFYIIYVLEHFIKMIYYSIHKECKYIPNYSDNNSAFYKAYRSLCFEIEARVSEYDNNFLENRSYFNEFKYLFKS